MTALALNTYAGLVEAVGKWALRSSNTAFTDQIDNFILLSTAAFNLELNPFQNQTTATITTSSAGVGALPATFSTPVSLTYSTYRPLVETGMDGIKYLNAAGTNTIPRHYALSGTSFILDAAAAVAISVTYVGGLAALSGSNTTNWLLTAAPHAYLYMCMAQGEAFNNNWQAAQLLEQKALAILAQVQGQADLAAFGNSVPTLRGGTP